MCECQPGVGCGAGGRAGWLAVGWEGWLAGWEGACMCVGGWVVVEVGGEGEGMDRGMAE